MTAITNSPPQPKVVSYYDTVDLSSCFIEKHEKLGDAASLETYKQWTQELLERVKGFHYFDKAEEALWLARIRAGRIDADAGYHRVFVMDNGSEEPFFASLPIITEWIKSGTSGVRLLSALLDVAEDPFGHPQSRLSNTLKAVEYRISDQGVCPYLEAVISHPRLDINRPIDEVGNHFIDHCMPYDCPNPSMETKEINKRASYAKALELALAHGAIVRRHYYECHAKEGSYDVIEKPPLKGYYMQAEQEWQDFESGKQMLCDVTPIQLGHAYSIGKLPQMLDSDRWHGHEALALSLFDALPEWVREHEPCTHPCLMLYHGLNIRAPHHTVDAPSISAERAVGHVPAQILKS